MSKINEQFEQLEAIGREIQEKANQWRSSVVTFLETVYGPDSAPVLTFDAAIRGHDMLTNTRPNSELVASLTKENLLFRAANPKHLVCVSELDQAMNYLKDGLKAPALVVAGTVLESTLRFLCGQNEVTTATPTTTSMNNELAKAGVYSETTKTQILAWMQKRDAAAQGTNEQLDALSNDEVEAMIDGIREFVSRFIG